MPQVVEESVGGGFFEHIVGVPGDSHAAQVVDDIVEKDIVKAVSACASRAHS